MPDLPDFRRTRDDRVKLVAVSDLRKYHTMLSCVIILQFIILLIVLFDR